MIRLCDLTCRAVVPLAAALALASTPLDASSAPGESGFAVAAAVRGSVQVRSAGAATGVPLASGEVVQANDLIVTGDDGRLHLMLSDGTVFMLGPLTEFFLSRYRYDPESSTGEINGNLQRGSLKLITGRIAEQTTDNVSVEMPVAVLAVRGTMIAAGCEQGDCTAVLLGPGARRNAADKQGSFAVIPKGAAVATGESEILVFRAGYAVTVDSQGNVSEPFDMSGREFGELVSPLARAGGGDDEVDPIPPDDDEVLGADDLEAPESELARNDIEQQVVVGDIVEEGQQDAGELDPTQDQLDAILEDAFEDGVDQGDALLVAQNVTDLMDLEDIAGLKGKVEEVGLAMDNGGTFDFRFEFGTAESAKLDFIGHENIQAPAVVDGELSWDVAVDGPPAFDRLDVSSDDGTLIGKDGCIGLCTGRATVLNAGQGNVAKFYVLELDTTDDSFRGTVVRKGGNNNFPGSK